jgi:hypothetical protein
MLEDELRTLLAAAPAGDDLFIQREIIEEVVAELERLRAAVAGLGGGDA